MLDRLAEIIKEKIENSDIPKYVLTEYSVTCGHKTIAIWKGSYRVMYLDDDYTISAFNDIDNIVCKEEKVKILNILMDSINQNELYNYRNKKYVWSLKGLVGLGDGESSSLVGKTFGVEQGNYWVLVEDYTEYGGFKTRFTAEEFKELCEKFKIDMILFDRKEIYRWSD